jgi:hypothetical protein
MDHWLQLKSGYRITSIISYLHYLPVYIIVLLPERHRGVRGDISVLFTGRGKTYENPPPSKGVLSRSH